MNLLDRAKALREAGNVERCHTILHHGSYSVASHGYGVASLLLLLHTDPSLALIKAALWHDSAERWVGDVPAPAKWAFEGLARESKAAEEEILARLEVCGVGLTEDETLWLKSLDLLELALWCRDQLRSGNQTVLPFLRRLDRWLHSPSGKPEPVWEFVQSVNADELWEPIELL